MLQLQRASAGSGKTYTLAKNFIWFLIAVKETGRPWRLRTPAEIADGLPRILAITFTNKATNEMKQRIVEKLAALAGAANPDLLTPQMLSSTDYLKEFAETLGVAPEKVGIAAKEALSILLNDYSDFRVSTIDSFFQSVLRTFAYESNLNDSYQVEIDSDYVAAAAIDATLDEVNRSGSAETAARRWLTLLMEEAADAGSQWNVFQKSNTRQSIYTKLRRALNKMESEEFKEIRKSLDDYFSSHSEGETLETVYRRLKEKMEAPLKESLANAKKKAALLQKALLSSGIDAKESCQRYFSGHLDKLRRLSFNDTSSSLLFKPLNLSGKSLLKKGVSHPDEPLLTSLAVEMYDSYATWLSLKESPEWIHWSVYAPLLPYLGLLGEARMKIAEYLETNNMIQLGETNSMLRKIIGEEDAPFIYERLGSVINHYLIDEFQDTSRMQWDNMQPLLKESDSRGEDNLVIGDAKQSIYRFRNADPSLITTTVPSLFPNHKAAGMSRADNTNWRSKRRIVEFNNFLFHSLASRMNEMKLGELDFADLYGNVAQYSRHREEKGYVEIRFLDAELTPEEKEAGKKLDDVLEEMAVSRIGPLISSFMERGIRQRDVAILVDTNDHGKAVIAALVEYNASLEPGMKKIDFISEESLLVSQAEAVNIIVNVLRHLAEGSVSTLKIRNNEEEDTKRNIYWNEIKCNFSFYALQHPELSPAEQIAGFLKEDSPKDAIQNMLDDMQTTALPALVEAITERFVPLELRRSQAVFLSAFQDMVLEYTERYAADAASFISWWESKGVLRSISSPEGTDAVQVMTVHKAKGLEFKCVILPLAHSSFEPTLKSEWRWVKPASVLADEGLPPFIPVETTKSLLETEHSSLYVSYHDLFMMDRLNSTYVAFTRAVDELYVFTRESKKGSALGYLLKEFCTPTESGVPLYPHPEPELILEDSLIEWNDDRSILTIGSVAEYVEETSDENKKKVRERCIEEYGVDSSPAILHYVEANADDTSTLMPQAADTDPRSEGNLLHGIMSSVIKASDLHRAVLKMKMRGQLSSFQAEEWEKMLEEALTDKRVEKWFDGSWKVLNERDIIFPKNKNRRPDRIMYDAGKSKAVIIDYKFGAIPDNDEHKKQVEDYMMLFREAMKIRHIEGYIWYVKAKEIIPV
ncbi:MAG: UvrD-helicase domain-containing protein [Muribaculaceae bacterium]|nr:UvrD-helicase domain-containing protein [Muribaculaceae bacterium]